MEAMIDAFFPRSPRTKESASDEERKSARALLTPSRALSPRIPCSKCERQGRFDKRCSAMSKERPMPWREKGDGSKKGETETLSEREMLSKHTSKLSQQRIKLTSPSSC